MDACDAVFSATYALNERIARAVFEALPEGGPVVAIMDGEGHSWVSDAAAFARVNLAEPLLDDLCGAVDDGVEPVRVQAGEASVTVTQLATEQTRCGYLVLVTPRSNGGASPVEHDLVEALLGQIMLAANLIEARCLLSDTQVRCYSAYGSGRALVN
jgi:hypothetical protein